MITEALLGAIDRGRQGENQGLSMGLPKFESYIDGVSRGTYTLLFGGTGCGKTSLALYSYIYRPIMENINSEDFKVIYYSLEMTAENLFAKLLSIYIWEKYSKEFSFKELLSRKKDYVLSDEDYQLVLDSADWLKRLEKIITIYDRALTSDSLYAHLSKEMEKHGTFEKTETRKIYHKNNPNLTVLVVLDHIGLVRKGKGRTKKEEIDLASSYLLGFRNRCDISPLVLMQMNRTSSSMDRRKGGFQEPQLDDIKDSGNPSEDAEIVISVFNPCREKMASYRGYDIKQLGNSFRSLIVLKNRYGDTDVAVGCSFFGKVGLWKELPKADDIHDYSQYTHAAPVEFKEQIIKEQMFEEKEDLPSNNIIFTM